MVARSGWVLWLGCVLTAGWLAGPDPARAGVIAGLGGWYGGGDFTVYQAGGFAAYSKGRTTTSAEFLGGTADPGGREVNRVDLNIATSLHVMRTPAYTLSVFAGYKMQDYDAEGQVDFSGHGPSVGATLALPVLSLSYALVRTTGGAFDDELIQIPTVSYRLAARGAPVGVALGYKGEIMEGSAVHGGFARAYIIVGR